MELSLDTAVLKSSILRRNPGQLGETKQCDGGGGRGGGQTNVVRLEVSSCSCCPELEKQRVAIVHGKD